MMTKECFCGWWDLEGADFLFWSVGAVTTLALVVLIVSFLVFYLAYMIAASLKWAEKQGKQND